MTGSAERQHSEEIENAIERSDSVGALEHLAGIGQSAEERYAFWMTYRGFPADQAIDAGVAELKQRIRESTTHKTSP